MSKNNQIRKSDKKFIRLEKARIRRQILDSKKQQELITNLYKRFLVQPEIAAIETAVQKISEPKVLSAKVKTTKLKVKKSAVKVK